MIVLIHSAKGSEWDEHQYVKKVDGNYYYPEGYTKGRTVASLEKKTGDSQNEKKENEDRSDTDSMALKVIRGDYGNGQDRKDALGEDYQRIQSRVNELMKSVGSTTISQASSSTVSEGTEAIKKVTEKKSTKKDKVHSGVDMDTVFSVYNKKRR